MYMIVHESPKNTWTVTSLLKEFSARGLKAVKVRASELSAGIVGGDTRIFIGRTPIDAPHAAIVRSLGITCTIEQYTSRMSILRTLEDLGTLVVNPVDSMLKARNKFESLKILRKHGIKVPDTVITESLPLALEYSRAWGETVVKPIIGSQGFGSLLAQNPDMTFNIARTLLSLGQPVYIQKYVEKPQRDIRVMVVDGEMVGSIYRVARRGEWRTNIAQGGRPRPGPRDPEVEEISLKAVEALGLMYGGVDLAEGKDGYYVLEVNSAPNWKGLQSVTGVNVASKIVEMIVKKARR